jgi:hypothetical protein
LPSVERVFGSTGQDARSSAYRRTVDRGVRDITEGLHGQAQGALADAYNSAGQMFNADASRMGALGATAGNLAAGDRTQTADLARQLQSAGITDAAALESIGQTQQQQTQGSLNLAYDDFQQQRDYPRSTVDWMSSVIRGLPAERSVSSTQTGPADVVGPSGLGQLASAATTGMGIWDQLKGNARGGRIRRSHGGALRYAHGS